MKKFIFILLLAGLGYLGITYLDLQDVQDLKKYVVQTKDRVESEVLLRNHVRAWASENKDHFASTVHDDVLYTAFGKSMKKNELLDEYQTYHQTYEERGGSIEDILLDGEQFAVHIKKNVSEKNGEQSMEYDQIFFGKIKDGKIISLMTFTQ